MGSGFRFGVAMTSSGSRAEWIEKCRRAEGFGYDVIGVPDHLGMPAPFPALIVAAEATQHVRLTTFVLNTPFYNPTLLAREVTTVDQLTDGRLELGLGAGWVRAEFDAANIPFPTGGQRVAHVTETAATLRCLFADPAHRPRPTQPGGPPLLIAGWGERMLRTAAEYADIIALTAAATADDGRMILATEAEAANRIAQLRTLLGPRSDTTEINMVIQDLIAPHENESALEPLARYLTMGEATDLEDYPALLVGTPHHMADQLHHRRETYGIDYITVLERNMAKFAPVLELLR